jgi:hypothetical protein
MELQPYASENQEMEALLKLGADQEKDSRPKMQLVPVMEAPVR